MWFLTRALDGLLLYNGGKPSGGGDFISLNLVSVINNILIISVFHQLFQHSCHQNLVSFIKNVFTVIEISFPSIYQSLLKSRQLAIIIIFSKTMDNGHQCPDSSPSRLSPSHPPILPERKKASSHPRLLAYYSSHMTWAVVWPGLFRKGNHITISIAVCHCY